MMKRIRPSRLDGVAILVAVLLAISLPVGLCCAFTGTASAMTHHHAVSTSMVLSQQGGAHCNAAADTTSGTTECAGALLTTHSQRESAVGNGNHAGGHAPTLSGVPSVIAFVATTGAIGAHRLLAYLDWRQIAPRFLFQSFLE